MDMYASNFHYSAIDIVFKWIICFSIITLPYTTSGNLASGAENSTIDLFPKITYVMDWDNYHGRLNPSASNVLTNALFEVHNFKRSNSTLPDFDVFGWTSHGRLVQVVQQQHVVPRGYVHTEHRLIHKLRDKARFKQFMIDIGLEKYVPKRYTDETAVFPCIIKIPALGEFGQGVIVVNSKQHLDQLKETIVQKHHYMLEEALSGMGYDEGIALGSVCNGDLISMRCAVHSHAIKDLTNSTVYSNGLYVRGIDMVRSRFYLTPCGKELVDVVKTIFKKIGSYTGPFCADMKADSKYNMKILEINPRNCHTHAYDDGIFLSSFVPLAFAIRLYKSQQPSADGTDGTAGTAAGTAVAARAAQMTHSAWFTYGGIFQNILDVERRVLATGGGPGYWTEVNKFDQRKVIKEFGYRDDLGLPKVLPKMGHD